jgi:hypothetical protein
MATKPHTPLDPSLLSMGQSKGSAAPAEILEQRPSAAPARNTVFDTKPAAEPRSGITIRIKVTAATRLDHLARRTGRTKQELLDTAIERLLDDADAAGGLTAPL